MVDKIFVDTSGFYSALVSTDDCHGKTRSVMKRAQADRGRFVTTDYVIDEVVTLLVARGSRHLVSVFLESLAESRAIRIEWMNEERFTATKTFLIKHIDHGWSFTDCFSFVVMKELRLVSALTKDKHFKQAGLEPLLT